MGKAGSSEIGAIIGKAIKVVVPIILGWFIKKGKDKYDKRNS